MTLKNWAYKHLGFVIFVGLIIRVALNHIVYSKDAESFVFWGKYLINHSIAQMYETLPGGFTPLPPVFYYVMRFLAQIDNFVNIWHSAWLTYLIFKIPIIGAEVLATILIYNFVKKIFDARYAFFAAVFYFLHPAIIYNTAVFGQIDSFVSVCAFVSVLLLIEKRIFLGLLTYLAGVLSKLQDLAILPLVLFYLIINMLSRFKTRSQNGLIGLITLFFTLGSIAFLPFLPVFLNKGAIWSIRYFYQLQNWYPYTSIYAYNFWAPTGFIVSDKNLFLGIISYKLLSLLIYWVVAGLVLIPLLKAKNRKPFNIIFAGFLLFFDFAFFSTRVHSRYLIYSFPFLAPLTPKYPFLAGALSLLMFANITLPVNDPRFAQIVSVLRNQYVIWEFVVFGFLLFVAFYKKYFDLTKHG